jgi:hypothetical protein
VSPTLYAELLQKHGDKCAICRAENQSNGRRTRLAVDHCHTTGRIRGLLCHRCNTALGLLQDSPELLGRAAAYLNHKE